MIRNPYCKKPEQNKKIPTSILPQLCLDRFFFESRLTRDRYGVSTNGNLSTVILMNCVDSSLTKVIQL